MNEASSGSSGLELSRLRDLLAELRELRADVVADEPRQLGRCGRRVPGERRSASVRNLAHYLSLRRHDLRGLQERLAEFALSSLGRCEGHVLDTIEKLVALLSMALGSPPEESGSGPVGYTEGRRILARNTIRLFGPDPPGRHVRIMVTLPSEAADDHSLVRTLLAGGMACARINCAHDDREAWARMVEHVRRAERDTGRFCRILMDLAGHKLRTGPLASGPAALHLRPARDGLGRIVGPARVRLGGRGERGAAAGETRLVLPPALLETLAVGDRLAFEDTRGKRRVLRVTRRLGGGELLAECDRSAWVGAGTRFRWLRRTGGEEFQAQPGEHRCTGIADRPVEIRLYAGDRLLITRDQAPAQPGGGTAPARIACTTPEVLGQLHAGEAVWIDDGRIGAVVEAVSPEGVLLEVRHTGPRGSRLLADKGLNFPDSPLELPTLTDKDREDLDFIVAHADMVGLSFAQSVEDLECLIAELGARDALHLGVVAKIETRRAVMNLPEMLLCVSDRHPLAVMIARGDLATEIGGERLAEIQEEMLWLCEAAHVPVIWATQVLETLTKKGVASRPELTDAATAVRAECVMLNKGPHICEAVRTLDDILVRMEDHQRKKSHRLRALHWSRPVDHPQRGVPADARRAPGSSPRRGPRGGGGEPGQAPL